MSDYYSHRTPGRSDPNRNALDYGSGSSAGWIWGAIAVIAIIVLIALVPSGSGVDPTAEDAPAAVTTPAASDALPPAADQ